MKEEIKSISEAFSMQPIRLTIVDEPSKYDPENSIKEIKYETERVGENEYLNYYVGYNFEGKKSFQYLANTVNIHYKILIKQQFKTKSMKYWIENIIGELYAVKYDDGNFSIIAYEGYYNECIDWINSN